VAFLSGQDHPHLNDADQPERHYRYDAQVFYLIAKTFCLFDDSLIFC
jgi:hypothetical protein